jgi:hypothetical protein
VLLINCSPLQIQKTHILAIATLDEQGAAQYRNAHNQIPESLNPSEYRMLGVMDQDGAVYTLRALDIAGSIYWRVYKHTSAPGLIADGLRPVEVLYEYSALKSTLGFLYGHGGLEVHGFAHAHYVDGKVAVFIRFPRVTSGGRTVIMSEAGIFAFDSDDAGQASNDFPIMAVATMEDGSFVRAYAKTGRGEA